jgi:S-layer protein (TIGR01567 family)
MKGLFQISEATTTVHTGDRFGNMEISSVGQGGINMTNSVNIGLNKGATVDIMGNLKIKVADNDSVVRFALTVDNPPNQEVRSTVYKDSNPVLEWTPYNFGINIGDTSLGFYYNLDDGVGSEKLTLTPIGSNRSIPDGGLVYSTSPQEVPFIYTGFGKYQAIGFMADNYFAGYTSNTGYSNGIRIVTRPTTDFGGISAIANGNLHKVLIDDDTKRTISVGGTIALKEGYVLKATDIDLNARAMLLTLLKDGSEVDVSPLSAGETYVYTKTIGGTESLPLIMVRFESVFSGQELQVAFLRGIFQISENPTKISVGDQFGNMEVRSISGDSITMSNSGSIGLSRNTNNALMGNIRLKVADTDAALRFYFAVDVTPEMIANQLLIDAPTKAMAGDTIRIKVTAGGAGIASATIDINNQTGTTDTQGVFNYTLPKELKGTYPITASMTGYEKATQNIEIEKYVDLRLSLNAPSQADEFETITINVLYNGTAMSGATVMFDNTTIGTSDSNGEVTYRLETSGTHSITASKISYISVTRDIDIRAPYSEFKALDINITPNSGFAGEAFLVRSNITNVGTMRDSTQVELIVNGTAVRSILPGSKPLQGM